MKSSKSETVLSYNSSGKLLEISDENGRLSFTYDSFGRVTSETGEIGVIKYEYNSRGLLSEKICSFHKPSTGNCKPETVNYLFDGNGNVIAICDSSGSITAKFAYSPFGEKISGDDLPFTFSTKAVDASGLSYYGFRFYNAELGRWLSRDPANIKGGYNLYGFINNSQINRIDIKGLMSLSTINCCGGKVMPEGMECCKSMRTEKIYNPSSHCCSDGKIYNDKEIESGIKLCEGPIILGNPFSADHEWIEVDTFAIGFATSGNIFGSWGIVRNDSSSYGSRPEGDGKDCVPQKLNPCDYDIDGVKNCIMSELGSTYWYIAGIRDCSWWVDEIFKLCKEGNKRKRQ